MSEENILSDDFLRQLTAAGEVDILVGVPTLNNAETIERVISAIQVGLVKNFPRARAAVVNTDGGSKDGTLDLVKSASVRDYRALLSSAPLRTMHTLTAPYQGGRGQGEALRIILLAAELLRAKACAMLSADLASVTPEWIESLVRPVYRENFDFVAPLYQRHRFDGLLIKQILSPLAAAVYGYEIEEPVATECGFSGRLASHYLSLDAWNHDFMPDGAAIWMTTTAMTADFRLCQTFLGPKIHSERPPKTDLPGTIQQVVGALFSCLEIQHDAWVSRQTGQAIPVFGFAYEADVHPVRLNRKRMLQMFQAGVEPLAEVLGAILSAATFEEIQAISRMEEGSFSFPDELWVKTVYDFAGAFHRSVINRNHLLQALTPLYRGRISSFLRENQQADKGAILDKLKALRRQFEDLKPYLMERWNAST